MDFSKTVDLIIKDLDDAREIIDDLKNYPGVPALQVELAKSKCKNAAVVIALFKNLQNSTPPQVKREQVIEEPQKKEPPAIKTEESLKADADSRKPVAGDQAPASEDKIHNSKKNPESTIIADTFYRSPDSLNEKLGSMRGDENFPDYLKSKPLTNLSQAIGVNDKFLFIRELFDGNPDSYEKAISRIDEAETLADAKVLITGVTGEKSKTEAGHQLLDLVKRKFAGDE